uniref:Katanin p80 WD40 repeat-containing subunit B1 homolog n=1 Tax=Kalanchoe fedtschenkoi TaxID=63787 RepID=A0A7N0RBQ6_KALFE
MSTKRAYKLQEFVAHTSSVNCLQIGRKSSRVLVTGGEDHKVNLWAIGKPNSILSLAGHTSGIDSVTFDSTEVMVAAGAASGTIKLWDLEEAKIVRTLTGHRSNCISVDFHPFGEFFASGSLDTNLKIWDIRKKGCIHTYKGHTRGVNAIRFTPDGRWVVSGGEDNTVKLWDLTAGKLLHEFKSHEGQIQCIDFHPHEFLLATGSSDRTVKFWDLETFELIGSAGPETSGVRCLTFNPDGRTLLCGLHESLKVFAWEPIRCHDSVDVGWSRLSDLNIHEGKLLGCSYNQSCVGVWVVDISRIEPYTVVNSTRTIGCQDTKSCATMPNPPAITENSTKRISGRLSAAQESNLVVKETKSSGRVSVSQSLDPFVKEPKQLACNQPSTPQRTATITNQRVNAATSITVSGATTPKGNSAKAPSAVSVLFNKSDVVQVIVPRNNLRSEQAIETRKEITVTEKATPWQPRTTDFQMHKISRNEPNVPTIFVQADNDCPKATELRPDSNMSATVKSSVTSVFERNLKDDRVNAFEQGAPSISEPPTLLQHQYHDTRMQKGDGISLEVSRRGRMRPLATNWEKRDTSNSFEEPTISNSVGPISMVNMLPKRMRARIVVPEKETAAATDEDVIAYALDQHDHFSNLMQSRLSKLQVVRRYWERSDLKGAISAMDKMSDPAVVADVISILIGKVDLVTLDICTLLLPLLTSLLENTMDRHLGLSAEMLLKLVRVFGSLIYSAVSASSPVGVDIEAEQRLERCNLCFVELEKVKERLPSLIRRGGLVAKLSQELNLALGDCQSK